MYTLYLDTTPIMTADHRHTLLRIRSRLPLNLLDRTQVAVTAQGPRVMQSLDELLGVA